MTPPTVLFPAGSKLAPVTINRKLWKGAARELELLKYIREVTGKGSAKKYVLAKDVPDVGTLRQEAVATLYTETLTDAVSVASSEVESLKDEMDEWASNLEGTGLEHTGKYEEVCEARDALQGAVDQLENVDLTGAPFTTVLGEDGETLPNRKVVVGRCGQRVPSSRHDRLDEALSRLQAVIDEIDAIIEFVEGENPDGAPPETVEDLREVHTGLLDAQTEMENVCFPGMF